MLDAEIFLPDHPDSKNPQWKILKGHTYQLQELENELLFDENFFDLHQTLIWNEISNNSKKSILKELSQNILSEALQIEMAGMVYASKMSLLSKTLDERQMFCEFASQEAKHYSSLRPFLKNPEKLKKTTEFSGFVANIVNKTDYLEGLLLVQTVLEGWGLSYYKELMVNALSRNLSNTFSQILRDEVKHHSSGVYLIGELLGEDHFIQSEMSDFMIHEMMKSISIGPVSVCLELLKWIQKPSKSEIYRLLEQLKAVSTSKEKMKKFRGNLEKVIDPNVLFNWERQGRFDVFTEDQMTEYIFSQSKNIKTLPPDPHLSKDCDL